MKTVSVLFLATLMFLATLIVGCGGYSSPTQTTQAGVVPVVTTLMPASAIHGGSEFTLTVTGMMFNANAVVNWNGTALASATQTTSNTLTVPVPAANIASTGTVQISVTTPGSSTPGGPYGGTTNTPAETSNNVTFTVN